MLRELPPTANEDYSQPEMLMQYVDKEFPGLADRVYLDSACIGVAPRRTLEAVSEYLHRAQFGMAESGTAQHARLSEPREEARDLAARLIGARPDDIAIVESATHGLSLAAQTLPLGPGDLVAVPDTEFLQMGLVWSRLRERGVEILPIPHIDGAISIDQIRAHLMPNVRVLALSSVQWSTGFRVDLDAVSQLCRDLGIWLVVDAAQHLGSLPFDVSQTPVDILTCSGHKWLNCPFGVGILYLSPRVREQTRPPMPGFFAAKSPDRSWGESFLRPDTSPFQDYQLTTDARAWEIGGTANFVGGSALSASLSLILEVGKESIGARILALTGHLAEGLARTGLSLVGAQVQRHMSGIVSFTTGSAAADAALMRYLVDAGISVGVRYTSRTGGIRVSCHYFNSFDDVAALLDVVSSWLSLPSR
ncbi:aminotransferase class V-fold PLP-dependent enzyme [Streptomyces shenzhenensis]|uniref:aminotransferase class V-fold PLP-dependent enzyme n=1 Tax=Streptomyces shenzhenensis TaxID=943815 RepID=UPI0033F14607